ncbi:MAG TPA: tripartite tricarboxylate transporter substrate binding protein [Bacilli bacterium]|nr:tripartite tricarboxylate transporter substrate binding protein [Bacilli bacterium]
MKKFTKLFSLALCSTLLLTAVGCGGNGSSDASKGGDASDFPKKAITLIVPSSAGGGTDATARALASATEKYMGSSIGVVNKPGGSGAIGMSEGANAKPDGYTVSMVFVELTTLNHLGLAPIKYTDFRPIALVNYDPAAVTVPADAPYNTLQEFLDYAKAHPGELKVGNAGLGSIWHLAAASVEKAAGVKFNNVPYEGAAPAVTALVGGHIDAVTVSPAEVGAQVKAGKLKTLAVMSDTRSETLPDVPTFKEAGVEAEPIATWRGLCVPKDTPDAVVAKLKDAFMKGAQDEEFTKFMKGYGLGVKLMDDKQFGDFMKQNDESFAGLIEELGLKK